MNKNETFGKTFWLKYNIFFMSYFITSTYVIFSSHLLLVFLSIFLQCLLCPSAIHHCILLITLHSCFPYRYILPALQNQSIPYPWPKPLRASHFDLRVGVTESSLTSVTMATTNASSPCVSWCHPPGKLP